MNTKRKIASIATLSSPTLSLLRRIVTLFSVPTKPVCGTTDLVCGTTDWFCGTTDLVCGTTDLVCVTTDLVCGTTDLVCGTTDLVCDTTEPQKVSSSGTIGHLIFLFDNKFWFEGGKQLWRTMQTA